MRKIDLFSMAAAFLLAQTACSDDLEGNGNSKKEPIEGSGVYLTVNVKTPGSGRTFTKAEGDKPTGGETGDGFLSALAKENKVSGVTIVLYGKENVATEEAVKLLDINTEGTIVIASSYTSATEEGNDDKYDNHTDKKATVRLNSEYLKTNTYYRILTIANADVTNDFVPGASLADCRIKTSANHKTGTGDNEVFIMSTHVEKNTPSGGSEEVHSIVSFTGTETTEEAAATGTVWVERLSARIDYTGSTFSFDVNSTATPSTKLATVSLEGVAPVNVAKHPVYIFKQLTESSDINGDLKALIDEKYTSATDANYVIEPTTTGRIATTATKQFETPFAQNLVNTLSFKTFNDNTWQQEEAIGQTAAYRVITYAGENTMAANQQNHGNTTGVIFKAKYEPESLLVYNETEGEDQGKVTSENKPTDGFTTGFYRVDDKLYQELEAAEAELILSGTAEESNPLLWLRKNFTQGTWTLPEAITFESLKSAVGTAATRKDLGYLSFLSGKLSESGVTAVNASDMNWAAFLNANSEIPQNTAEDNKVIASDKGDTFTIEYFGTGHTCYYPWWIRHANNGNDTEMGIMEFCIVRNNVYRLNVTSINGLGMADPFDSVKKPDEGEEEDVYLKVELYVHDWVVRENENIALGKQ